ncbi:MAG: hypothetical protein WCC17_26230 [Candidatus Nitrosopolaris sp.]
MMLGISTRGNGGRMIISDLLTDREVDKDSVNVEKWCSCIDGALTKENYLDSIRNRKQDLTVLRCYKKRNIWKIRQMVESSPV